MSIKDSLGDRIKTYEDAYRLTLPIRMPVILRLDGKAFHSYTRGLKRPVDEKLVKVMNMTAQYLCKHVQGCTFAYVQSDEISLLLNNFKTLDTQSWYDNNLQKMVSVSAAMASAIFTANSWYIWHPEDESEKLDYIKPALFDSRAFVIPKEDVCNYFLWRQQDATRNSVQMLARSLYSHKECEDKPNTALQEMTWLKGQNWNDCPTSQRRGRCIVKTETFKQGINPKTGARIDAMRSEWIVDNEIPIFSQDRQYVEKYL